MSEAERTMRCHPVGRGGTRACTRLLVLAAVLALLTGCAGEGLQQGPGGMPPQDLGRVSLVVAQTRAQFPSLSGTAIPYRTRAGLPPDAAAPEPALFGQGVGIQRGIQTGERPRMAVRLYLDKQDYVRGYALVTPPGGKEERWPIVAFDQRGDAQGRFDFAYLLATPQGTLRYLVVIGGSYEDGGTSYVGYEGTLVEPGEGHDLEHWRMAYKVDFGYRFPGTPHYAQRVKETDRLFDSMRGRLDRLERAQSRIGALQGQLADLRGRQGTGTPGAAAQIDALEGQLSEQQATADTLVAGLERDFVRYYALRTEVSKAYAAFVESNRYRWRDLEGKRAFYNEWKIVELHHPEIDHMVERFLPFTEADEHIQQARQSAMAVIIQNDNWDKYPGAESAGTSPRQ